MRETFAQKLPEGTELELVVKTPNGEKTYTKIEVLQADKKFLDSFSDILS